MQCTRIIEFDAAHRVIGHENKCQFLHGHRYKIEATFYAKQLNNIGMVIDFGIIKKILGTWIDDNWDHTTILNQDDDLLAQQISNVTGQKIYKIKGNPTAENMADYLLNTICPMLFRNSEIICQKIRIYETPNCYAESTLEKL